MVNYHETVKPNSGGGGNYTVEFFGLAPDYHYVYLLVCIKLGRVNGRTRWSHTQFITKGTDLTHPYNVNKGEYDAENSREIITH